MPEAMSILVFNILTELFRATALSCVTIMLDRWCNFLIM